MGLIFFVKNPKFVFPWKKNAAFRLEKKKSKLLLKIPKGANQ